MFNVLHIMAGADAGGISTVVLNYYRWMDRSVFHFDIAVTTDQIGQNAAQLKELGAEIYRIPLKSQGIRAYEKAIVHLLNEKHYDAIHVHENDTSYVALRIAKQSGVKCRLAHAHSTIPAASIKAEIKRVVGCVLNYKYATCVVGCGQLAGERVFGKRHMMGQKAVILPNAIDTQKFHFETKTRTCMRKEMGLDDKYVIGMVGRLSPQKNHQFALKLMKAYHRYASDAVLLLIGNGEDERQIEGEIKANQMCDYVHMLGRRGDVDKLYQVFDVLIMPSWFEGFPVAAVEAMATGLPVLLSDRITRELEFGQAVSYLSLDDLEAWQKSLDGLRQDGGRASRCSEPAQHGLDIRDTAKQLQTIYLAGGQGYESNTIR